MWNQSLSMQQCKPKDSEQESVLVSSILEIVAEFSDSVVLIYFHFSATR